MAPLAVLQLAERRFERLRQLVGRILDREVQAFGLMIDRDFQASHARLEHAAHVVGARLPAAVDGAGQVRLSIDSVSRMLSALLARAAALSPTALR